MRDAPRPNPRYYRKEEWVAYGVDPRVADSVARRHTRGRFFVCAICGMDESQEKSRTEFKQLGYRLLTTEPLFVHRLKRIPQLRSRLKISRIRTQTMAEQFGKITRSRPIPSHNLAKDAPFRQYVALDGTEIVGWVRSVDAGDSTWCSNMFVVESHRRRGIGSAMLAKMLRDDRSRNMNSSVLLSSHTGALLYPGIGYEQIGILLMYVPKKK
jgi:GNAT superfamily N-acetyltransferase